MQNERRGKITETKITQRYKITWCENALICTNDFDEISLIKTYHTRMHNMDAHRYWRESCSYFQNSNNTNNDNSNGQPERVNIRCKLVLSLSLFRCDGRSLWLFSIPIAMHSNVYSLPNAIYSTFCCWWEYRYCRYQSSYFVCFSSSFLDMKTENSIFSTPRCCCSRSKATCVSIMDSGYQHVVKLNQIQIHSHTIIHRERSILIVLNIKIGIYVRH